MRKLPSWNWKKGGCTLYLGVCSMNFSNCRYHTNVRTGLCNGDRSSIPEWMCLFNADFNVLRVVDVRNESNVMAGEVDVVVERPGSMRSRK